MADLQGQLTSRMSPLQRKPYYNGIRFRGIEHFFGRPPNTFDLRSRSVEGVWGCSWALGLSTRDVRRAGTVCSGPRDDPLRSEKKLIHSDINVQKPLVSASNLGPS